MNHRLLVERFQEGGGAFGVGIAYENLTEALVVDHANEALYALGIEFVKDVVEEQYGLAANGLVQHFERRELKRDEKALLLALRPYALQGMAV